MKKRNVRPTKRARELADRLRHVSVSMGIDADIIAHGDDVMITIVDEVPPLEVSHEFVRPRR